MVIDFSGRPSAHVDTGFRREMVGHVATENLTHFFHSLAMTARMTLHVDLLKGDNDHHRAEAAFKALALALRQAVALDGGTACRAPRACCDGEGQGGKRAAADRRGVRSVERRAAGALGVHRRRAADDGTGTPTITGSSRATSSPHCIATLRASDCRAIVDGPEVRCGKLVAIPDVVVT